MDSSCGMVPTSWSSNHLYCWYVTFQGGSNDDNINTDDHDNEEKDEYEDGDDGGMSCGGCGMMMMV